MQLQLNIFSTNTQKSLTCDEFCSAFLRFRELCYFVNDYVDNGIGVEGLKKNLTIGGISITSVMQDHSSIKKQEMANVVISVYHKYLKDISCPHSAYEFALTNQFLSTSNSIASALDYNQPIISFDCNQQFCRSQLSGYTRLEGSNNKGKPCQVKNIYDVNTRIENLLLLQTFETCAALSPLMQPMWNKEGLKHYFEMIKHADIVQKMVDLNSAERIKMLNQYAPQVAKLNGWEENKTLSRINSTSHKPRRIFYSKWFGPKNYYLSIDYEKSDFVFELFDTRGKHIKEINWKGEKTGEGRSDHNIQLHKL